MTPRAESEAMAPEAPPEAPPGAPEPATPTYQVQTSGARDCASIGTGWRDPDTAECSAYAVAQSRIDGGSQSGYGTPPDGGKQSTMPNSCLEFDAHNVVTYHTSFSTVTEELMR